MILSQVLARSAERYPDMEAVVGGNTRYTYAALYAGAARLAHALRLHGTGPGDRVLILLKNRVEHVLLYWALQKRGAVPVPVNWRYAPGEVEYVARDAEVRAVAYERASAPAVQEALSRLEGVRLALYVGDGEVPPGSARLEDLVAAGDPMEPDAEGIDAESPAIFLYTSGTTGRPKGVPRSHRAEYAAALAHIIRSRNQVGDRTLGIMPLYHTMGIRSLLAMAVLNGCLVMQPDWDPGEALALIERERINSLYLVPTLYHDMVHHPDVHTRDLRSLKKLGYAGAPMAAALVEKCCQIFQPEVFVNHYGSTEIYTFTVCDRVREKPGCAGRPGLHTRIRIVRPDPDRNARPDEVVRPGEVGEIVANLDSPEAFRGYWRRPDADARAIKDGWYFTGDLGYVDAEGDLWVVGRVDDMIISGGENIHPGEVEEVLLRHPSVKDVCVVGLPDDRWGQRVVAFVVPHGRPPSPAELDEHCRQAADLSNFKRPREYVFVRAIPRSPTGKVLRRKLREGDYQPLLEGSAVE